MQPPSSLDTHATELGGMLAALFRRHGELAPTLPVGHGSKLLAASVEKALTVSGVPAYRFAPFMSEVTNSFRFHATK